MRYLYHDPAVSLEQGKAIVGVEEARGQGPITVRKYDWKYLEAALPQKPIRNRVHRPPEPDYSTLLRFPDDITFAEFLERFIFACGRGRSRFAEVISARIGAEGQGAMTRQQVAAKYGYSPVYVGQIESDSKSKFRKRLHYIVPSVIDIPAFSELLRRHGGAASYDDAIYGTLLRRFTLTEKEKPIAKSLASFLNEYFTEKLFFRDAIEIVYDENHPCMQCEKVKKEIAQIFLHNPRGEWESGELSSRVLETCSKCKERKAVDHFSNAFLSLKKGRCVYKEGDILVRRHGSVSPRRDPLLQFMKNAGSEMHLRDIHAGFEGESVNSKDVRNCLLSLLRSEPDIVRWGHGTYIHKDNAKIPVDLIKKLERVALYLLSHETENIQVEDLYKTYAKRCAEKGLPSGVALYTCMKLLGHPKLSYPKYPRICLKKLKG